MTQTQMQVSVATPYKCVFKLWLTLRWKNWGELSLTSPHPSNVTYFVHAITIILYVYEYHNSGRSKYDIKNIRKSRRKTDVINAIASGRRIDKCPMFFVGLDTCRIHWWPSKEIGTIVTIPGKRHTKYMHRFTSINLFTDITKTKWYNTKSWTGFYGQNSVAKRKTLWLKWGRVLFILCYMCFVVNLSKIVKNAHASLVVAM